MQHRSLLILMAGKEPHLAWADTAHSLACVVVLTLRTALQGWVGDGPQLNMAFWGLTSLQAKQPVRATHACFRHSLSAPLSPP